MLLNNKQNHISDQCKFEAFKFLTHLSICKLISLIVSHFNRESLFYSYNCIFCR